MRSRLTPALVLGICAPLLAMFVCGCAPRPAPKADEPSKPHVAAEAPPPPAHRPGAPSQQASDGLAPGPATFADGFDGTSLDNAAWVVIQGHDLRLAKVDLVDRGAPADQGARRLRVAADSIGTDDRTVKSLGVRSAHAWGFGDTGRKFSVKMDWNDQANGAYLTVALYLCPTETDANPEDEPSWLKWEYVGVPQDNLVRAVVARRRAGRRDWLERYGWPAVRQGRDVGEHRIEMFVDGRSVVIREEGVERYRWEGHDLGFDKAIVYLVMTTHSNYFERTLFFDDFQTAPASVPAPTPEGTPRQAP